MNGSFLLGGLVMLALGAALARNGIVVLRAGADRLRSARARAIAETAAGGVFVLFGVAAVILAFIAKHRLPALLATVIALALFALFAAAGSGWVVGGAAAWSERRHARRAHRELGIAAPRPLWSVTTIGVMWALAFVGGCLIWAVAWAVSEGVARPGRPPSQHAVHLALIVLIAVIGPLAVLHMALQAVRRHNRVRQLTQPVVGEDPAGARRLMAAVPCPGLWCSGERTWVRRVSRHRAVHVPLVRLARVGVSSAVAAPPLPGWAAVAWTVDASRWSVAIWRVDLVSGDARITTVAVARPGNSGTLAVIRAVARHALVASLAFLAGAVATYLVWPPAGVLYAIVVGGIVAGAGVIVPSLRDDCRTASGEQLGIRGERALADLSASGEDLDAWRRLWTALPVPRAIP
jgi:hypothetical protein